MEKIESVPCVPCAGQGFKYEQITGHETTCRACLGAGEVYPCEAFSSTRPAAFRNRVCDGCHATERQHELIRKYDELANA